MSNLIERANDAISNGAINRNLLAAMRDEIERLTAENKIFRKTIDTVIPDQGEQIKRLQARVEELEDIIRRALAVPPNWGAQIVEIEIILGEAATEQGETDE